jgi:hypothetical protein
MGLACLPAEKPGGVLLFHRLSDSTIGAVWFHGRVRDGIGWGTDAMTTKLLSRRTDRIENRMPDTPKSALVLCRCRSLGFSAVDDGGVYKRDQSN